MAKMEVTTEQITHAFVSALRVRIEKAAALSAAYVYAQDENLMDLTPEQLTGALKRLASAGLEGKGADSELNRQAMRAAIQAVATCLDGTVMPPWMSRAVVRGLRSLGAGSQSGISMPAKSAGKGDRLLRKDMARALATMVHFEIGLSDVTRETALLRVAGVSRRMARQSDKKRSFFYLTLNRTYTPALRLLEEGEHLLGAAGRDEARRAGELMRMDRQDEVPELIAYLEYATGLFNR